MQLPANTGGDMRDELRDDAATLGDSAKQRLYSEANSKKSGVADEAKSVSSALNAAAEELSNSPSWLRTGFEKGASSLEQLAKTLENKDSRELTRDAQAFARQHPGTFLAGCAIAGFAAARVMKAGMDQGSGTSPSEPAENTRYDPYASTGKVGSQSAFSGMDQGNSTRETRHEPA